jgi:hypothetical protein
MKTVKFGENKFEIASSGIIENTINKRRIFNFSSDLSYPEIETILINPDNISNIQYIIGDDIVNITYSDCVSLKVLSKNLETKVYTAEFSTDMVELKLKQLEAQIEAISKLQTTIQSE